MKVDNVCLSFINELLVQVPVVLGSNINNSLDISNIDLSKNKIYINSSSKYIDNKLSYFISILLVFVSILTLLKSYENYSSVELINNKVDSIKIKNNMPATSLQTKSIISKYKKIAKEQIEFRKVMAYILDTQRIIGGQIINIEFKNSSILASFKDVEPKKVTNHLEKEYTLNSAVVKDSILTVGLDI